MGGDFAATTGVSVQPNPATSSTTVTYSVQNTGNVTVELFDAVGQRVQTLVNDNVAAGVYDVQLNAGSLGSGSYIVKVTNGSSVTTSTLTIVR